MTEKQENQEIVEIDLIKLLQVIWKKLWLVVLAAIVFAGAAFAGTYYLITPIYQSSVKMYVNNSSINIGSTKYSISSSELSAAQTLVDTYLVILKTRTTLNEVILQSGCGYNYNELKNNITSSALNGTEIFEIIVADPDPDMAVTLANTIADVLPDKISNIVAGSSVRVVDRAVRATDMSSPDYAKNTVVGAMLGIVLIVMILVLREMFEKTIHNEDSLHQDYDIPVLAVIPDILEYEKSNTYTDIDYARSTAKRGNV